MTIVVVTIVAFWPVTRAQFTNWDDDHTVSANTLLLPPTLQSLGRLWAEPRADLWVPITYSTWWAVAKLSVRQTAESEYELSPAPFHAANLAIHTLSALAVFALLRRLLQDDLAACAGALVFAVHPIQVEAVAWVSGLKDVLAGAFSAIAVWQYVAYAQSATPAQPTAGGTPAASANRATTHYVFSLIAFVLAMLAKPGAVTVPLVALAIDVLMFRRRAVDVARAVIPMFVLAVPLVVAAARFQPASGITTAVPWHLRPLVAADALAFYLSKVVAPFGLAIDYGRSPRNALQQGYLWWTWVLPVSAGICAVALRRRTPWLLAGAGVFVAAVVPMLGFARFDFQEYSTVADHYAYFAMTGVGVMVAGACAALARKHPARRRVAAASIAVVVLGLATLAFAQARHWRDSRSLYTHVLTVNPKSWAAENNLAEAMLQARDPAAAEQHLRNAISLRPSWPDAYVNLGVFHAMTNDHRKAIQSFRRAIALKPDLVEAYLNLGISHGALEEMPEAARAFEAVLRLDPAHRKARQMLGWAREWRARTAPGEGSTPAPGGTTLPTAPVSPGVR